MSFTVEQKSLLTKLMASENLTVEHQKISTARFDVKNRILYLPIWQNMEGFMYDHLGGHEVGHALYTPEDGWHDVAVDKSKGKNYKSFLNVIEDARIEKKVSRKFPGLKTSFRKGFQELVKRDFFGIKFKNVNALPFIDRLNLYTKSQYSEDSIEFSLEEKVFVLKAQNLETWEDVLSLTDEIYEYSKSEQSELQLKDFEPFDPSNENNDGDYDFDESDFDSSDEKTPSEENNDTSDSSQTEEGDEDGEEESDKSSELNRYKDSQDSDSDFEPQCNTDDSYRQNENSLLDEKCKPYIYVDIPTVNHENTFTPAKRVQELLSQYYDNDYYGLDEKPVGYYQKLVNEFKNKNERYIGLLAKEFEMRKAAKAFSKSKISDTGDIDINKLSTYKFDDNIFRKVLSVPKGKSHGLILLLDCSGSMHDNMSGSIEQILILSMFCRKVNIPFRVFGFTDCSGTFNIDRKLNKFDLRGPKSFSTNTNELGLGNVQLREYLNSNMSNNEFSVSLRNMILLKHSYSSGRNKIFGRPESENLSNTPLIQAVVAVNSIMDNFKKSNNIDLVSLIIVHDGDTDSCARMNVPYVDSSKVERMMYSNFDIRRENIVIRDRKNKFEHRLNPRNDRYYEYHTTELLLHGILEWISVVNKIKVFGFFILGSRRGATRNAIRNRFHFQDGTSLNDLRLKGTYDETEKSVMKKFREEKFLISSNKGYNAFYLISGGSDLEVEDDEIEIDGKVTSSKLKMAFMKMSKKRQVNRVLVSKFIQGIAA